ncbi:hypothetical protein DM02DRAFT_19503 [Periconia macrospinosa]|uniref:Uncharacterized protein n=1 Tax=Periconia macrospinosa TaxID=97972 RepID=A0A2V1CXP8_9PLEO|nr:hypothetical protein DM02DRAFT_19503 [Periconia macrospinosa]
MHASSVRYAGLVAWAGTVCLPRPLQNRCSLLAWKVSPPTMATRFCRVRTALDVRVPPKPSLTISALTSASPTVHYRARCSCIPLRCSLKKTSTDRGGIAILRDAQPQVDDFH